MSVLCKIESHLKSQSLHPTSSTNNKYNTVRREEKLILHGKILYHHCLFTNLQWMLDYYD